MKPEQPQTEEQFLAAYDASEFPHPSLSVDVALVTTGPAGLQAVFVRRSEHPSRGRLALPGGFVDMRESLDEAAARVLVQKAGLSGVYLEQLYTFGDPGRDPRTRVVSVAYFALVHVEELERAVRASAVDIELRTLSVPWEGELGGAVEVLGASGAPEPLAFDHAGMLGLLVKRLRGKLAYAPLAYELLPDKFTLRQVQETHEIVLGRALNKDSFRRSLLASGEIVPTGEHETDTRHRPAELYRQTPRKR